ncbi:hypothetical protein MHD_06670 [Mannheimia granulomatis]|uniref:Uncharacterized protein n=1 Tax=Mannheimia granulomatis TaxID=85402 RepID=A0A011NE95_9PAST|nr:hypothetical protein AK33_03410 [Mannheimia granulomatis]RGE48158.1 hypothetical protein MHD_06670 [Mannheimia granulomatis]
MGYAAWVWWQAVFFFLNFAKFSEKLTACVFAQYFFDLAHNY